MAVLALPGLALSGKGLWALATGQMWMAPRHSAPVLLQGAPATWGGAAYLLAGLALFATLAIELRVPQKKALSVAIPLGLLAGGAFVMSFVTR